MKQLFQIGDRVEWKGTEIRGTVRRGNQHHDNLLVLRDGGKWTEILDRVYKVRRLTSLELLAEAKD